MKEQFTLRKILIVIFFMVPVLASSLIYLYQVRFKILSHISLAPHGFNKLYNPTQKDYFWAEEIMKGGYILHFRHAERDKWIDVQMYDILESDVHNNGKNQSRLAENAYFADAVCLNARGTVQAQAMGELLEEISLPIGYVISSPICRSRQTAELAFGGYDELNRMLVHKGPYNEKEKDRIEKLKQLYSQLTIVDGTNTIVSSHNSVISPEMFVKSEISTHEFKLEEGGFYVISKTEKGLNINYKFHNFLFFIKAFYDR
jgi:phosphohistidine phosphatase SixA